MIKKCEYCGKEFKTTHSEQKCCSRKCDSKKRSIEKVKLKCPICGKIFFKKASDIKNVKGTPCCSLECSKINGRKYKDLGISISKDRLHHIWYGMIDRCYNSKNDKYCYYGQRGIKVFAEWKEDFKAFRQWALNNGYEDNLSIERIDVNGNYCPENCTWITMKEQAKNKQNTLKIFYDNELVRLIDISKKENIGYKDLWANYKKYQDINKAIEICKMHNDNLFITNKSGHRGVYFYKNKWTAFYNHKYIGRFDTFNEAVQARLNAEQGKKKAS